MLYGRASRTLSEAETEDVQEAVHGVEEILRGIDAMRTSRQDAARAADEQEIGLKQLEEDETAAYAVGDVVMKKLEPFERSSKLDDCWCGSYQLVRVFGRAGSSCRDWTGCIPIRSEGCQAYRKNGPRGVGSI